MTKKLDYFYMRISKDQKKMMKEMSAKKNMTMTQYVWHLITKDTETQNDTRKDNPNA